MPFCKSIRICLSFLILFAGLYLFSANKIHAVGQGAVHLIQLSDDTINPVTAEYIVRAIDRVRADDAQCLIIKLDTPGGLLSSTRLIVKAMLMSKVPIVVYIAPSGSRAGSAGVFITYASHIAAMAPSTNIGAAHPVQMGFKSPKRPNDWREMKEFFDELQKEKKDNDARAPDKPQEPEAQDESMPDSDPMSSKILQDTVAFVKAIAKERNRNVDWAVSSVVKSESITSEEAMEKGVVELIAKSDEELLDQLEGRRITIDGKEIILRTKEASIVKINMDARQEFFNVLANPNIAYFLMILGFYGLLFEVTHPGFGVPGILGVAFLILAFYSMQTLPTNYAGLALLALGIILLFTEAYTPTFGILTLGGITCMVLGSLLLFESVDPIMRVSKSLIYSFSITTGLITLFLVQSVIRSLRAKVQGGQEGLIGETGETMKTIASGQKGKVFVHGELWNARSTEAIKKGEEVKVTEVDGLTIHVEKIKKEG